MRPAQATAIILAAGLSSRMHEFKPLLPLEGKPALERLITSFREAGVEDVLVVVGHRRDELIPLVERLGGRVVANRCFRDGMFSSVQVGIRHLRDEENPFFVIPVDVALVRPATIRRMLAVFAQAECDVLYPSFLGLRGHPPLIAGRLARQIRYWRGDGGLKGALRQWQTNSLEVMVPDETILCDMDTPDDFQRLQAMARHLGMPNAMERRVLLTEMLRVEEPIIRHGRAVARLAVELGELLNRAGCGLDIPLLQAAAEVHDLARRGPDHARTGARLLREAGFEAAAHLVATHMDLVIDPREPVGEAEVLFLADKLVQGEERVTLAERFRPSLERFGAEPDVLRQVRRRLATARSVQERLERVLGVPLPGEPAAPETLYLHAV